MNALLISPRQPNTFFTYNHALPFVRKKAALPPLGLLTVAALLPRSWSMKVVDLDVEPLTEQRLRWADVVLISAMVIQKESALDVIERCKEIEAIVVVGGPLFSLLPQDIDGVDHYVVGEAEELLPAFLSDLQSDTARRVYQSRQRPEMSESPLPAWRLLNLNHYHSMSVQVSRGCPFDCEFCDIVRLFGRRPRFKTPDQVLSELDTLYRLGWSGDVMFVDDNFIGHKGKARELLVELIAWQASRGFPFAFNTQASVNLAQEPELMELMSQANLNCVFLGIETPAPGSLQECQKKQNQNIDLVTAVRTLQHHGIMVSGGFILGFDSDPDSIFDDQVRFIEQAAIPTAMVGLLSVGPGTRLYERLEGEGRVVSLPTGNNTTDASALNFVPRMQRDTLLDGYRSVLSRLYDPKAFYARVLSFLKQWRPARLERGLPRLSTVARNAGAAVRLLWRLGVVDGSRRDFWRFLLKAGLRYPSRLVTALNLAAAGYHFHKTTAAFIAGVGVSAEEPLALPAGANR
jgi:radical SAM superfamily enzyme YgiQ (UPF0313 family)